MNNITKECAICLCKIYFFQYEKKLKCKHGFHRKCIESIYKNECPLCRRVFISKQCLKQALKRDAITLIYYIENVENKNVIETIFLEQFFKPQKKYECLQKMIYTYFDFTDLVMKNLDNSFLFWDLIAHNVEINWYKTFNTWQFDELVVEKTKDQNVIFFVKSKFTI